MISLIDIGWLAGLLEGEGSFVVRYHEAWSNGMLRISLAMTDEDVVRRLYQVTNLGKINGPYKLESGKLLWKWTVASQEDVVSILMTIYPLMGSRRKDKIKELLEIWKKIPYGICKRGHKKGKGRCKICFTEYQRQRRLDSLLGY